MRTPGTLALGIVLWPVVAGAQETDVMRCTLHAAEGQFVGRCVGEGEETPGIRLRSMGGRDPFSLEGTWGTSEPPEAWGQVAVAPPSQRFDSRGVIEMSCCGWFSLNEYRATPDLVEFAFSWDNDGPPPSEVDLRIVDRARAAMANPTWDRDDDRVCGSDDVSISLYCALMAASRDEMGRPHHSQTALRVVRGAINVNFEARVTNHTLMDFNNHPDTTLEEIADMLELSATAIRAIIADPSLWPPTGGLYAR